MMAAAPMSGDDGYLIEFLPMGNAVKVSAIDPMTGIEVSIVGSATASQHDLAALAVRKLRYVLTRGDGPEPGQPAAPAGGAKKGIIA